MKPVIREYFASLKERGELDAVLPDLLTELGFTVYSRPSRGTRQYGVDVAAVGTGRDGINRVHLFSIKSGNLDRTDWNTASPQSLRPSLDEILDHYIGSRIPPEYAALPIAICLTFGGTIDEQVRAEVNGYMIRNSTERISYEEWNGDRLSEVVLNGILREDLLPTPLRSHLRKSVAMVEEPDISLVHFNRMLRALIDTPNATASTRLSRARLINICLWIVFAWAREADNVEAPYRASEHALLEVWHLLKGDIGRSGKSAEAAGVIINELAMLHFAIWDELFDRKILPHVDVRHGLSSAINSQSAIDINLKLFDIVGRLALRGLWLVWQVSPNNGPAILSQEPPDGVPRPLAESHKAIISKIDQLCRQLTHIVTNNQALLSPIGDWQAIDVGLAFTLLACRPDAHAALDEWVEELTRRSIFAFKTHGRYPITSRSYWDLVDHPAEHSDEYRQSTTEGSILYPMLALWAAVRGKREIFDEIAAFKVDSLNHCAFQTWLPDEDSEENIYLGRSDHGAALTEISVNSGMHELIGFIKSEVSVNPHYDELSATRLEHWPIVLVACRAHRLPVPPQVWRNLLPRIYESVVPPALQLNESIPLSAYTKVET